MWEDPIVAEVRRVREQLAAKFNYDVKAIIADIQERQRAAGDRLISPPHHEKTAQPASSAECRKG